MDSEEIKELIKRGIDSTKIQKLLNSEEFYFQHLLDIQEKYFNYTISNSEIEEILKSYEAFKSGTFETFVLQSEDSIKPFLEILAEYISYLDKNASGKNRWNKYSDRRTIALAFVRMPHWVKYLLKLKIDPDTEPSDSIQNAVQYSIQPENNLTVLSGKHRATLSDFLLKKNYDESTFQEDVIDYFRSFGISPKNHLNYTHIISSILYLPEIKSLWNPKQKEKGESSIEQDEDFLNHFINWLDINNISLPDDSLNQVTDIIGHLIDNRLINEILLNQLNSPTIIQVYQVAFKTQKLRYPADMHFKNFLKDVILRDGNLFSQFRDYLSEKDLTEGTQTAYLDHVLYYIPKLWKDNYQSDFNPKTVSKVHYERVLRLTYSNFNGEFKGKNNFQDFMNSVLDDLSMEIPLNQILYGPPGTGKTFKILSNYVNLDESVQEKKASSIIFIEEKYRFWHLAPGQYGYLWNRLKAQDFLGYEWCDGTLGDLRNLDKNTASYDIKSRFSKVKKGDYFCVISGKKFYAIAEALHDYDFSLSSDSEFDFQTIHVKWIKQFNKPQLLNASSTQSFSKLNGSKRWESVIEALENEDIYFTSRKGTTLKKAERNYSFVSFHQSFAYEDFIEGIKPDLTKNDEDAEKDILSYIIQDGIFKTACDKAANLAGYEDLKACLNDSRENRSKQFINAKPYYLLIDEINRGNISAIFGELITLIEEDKRLGGNNELSLNLPYSKDLFGVPKNLYIIGTMNTADRSVEALDTALRRRFAFVEVKSNPDLLDSDKIIYTALWEHKSVEWTDNQWIKIEDGLRELFNFNENWEKEKYDLWEKFKKEGFNPDSSIELKPYFKNRVDLKKLLKVINQRIELLIDKDHQIGHSYFLKIKRFNDLVNVFKDNIIPLLEEYFYGDYGKIGLVLGKGFIEISQKENVIKLADFEHEDKEIFSEKKIYCFTNPNSWELESFQSIYDNNV